MFKIIDDNNSRSIDLNEFKKGVHDYGLNLEPGEVQEMFRVFDKDGSGTIDFDEFLQSLRVGRSYKIGIFLLMCINQIRRNMTGLAEASV